MSSCGHNDKYATPPHDDVFDHVGHLGNGVYVKMPKLKNVLHQENSMFVIMSSDSALSPFLFTACMSSNLLDYKDSVDDVLMK